jgi:hypothetical protein
MLRHAVGINDGRFRDAYYSPIMRAMMEAVSTTETSVSFYHAALRNIPEDRHLNISLL